MYWLGSLAIELHFPPYVHSCSSGRQRMWQTTNGDRWESIGGCGFSNLKVGNHLLSPFFSACRSGSSFCLSILFLRLTRPFWIRLFRVCQCFISNNWAPPYWSTERGNNKWTMSALWAVVHSTVKSSETSESKRRTNHGPHFWTYLRLLYQLHSICLPKTLNHKPIIQVRFLTIHTPFSSLLSKLSISLSPYFLFY